MNFTSKNIVRRKQNFVIRIQSSLCIDIAMGPFFPFFIFFFDLMVFQNWTCNDRFNFSILIIISFVKIIVSITKISSSESYHLNSKT